MGIFDIFKRDHTSYDEKDMVNKVEKDAHLEKLIKNAVTIYFTGSSGSKVSLFLRKIGTYQIAFKPITPVSIKPGEEMDLEYELSGGRFRFTTTLEKVQEENGILITTYPEVIHDNDRRRERRLTFPQRARPEVQVLESISGGIGFAGSIINLSTLGIGVIVDKVVDLKTGKDYKVKSAFIKEGMKASLIRFKFEGTMLTEVSGRVVYSVQDGNFVKVGIEFDPLSPMAMTSIRNALQRF